MSDAPIGPDDFQTLLQLQEHDTAIDQLMHQRSHLPGIAAVQGITERAGALRNELAAASAQRDVKAERQASLEAEIAANEARVAEINARLYGSDPIGSKDAQAMLDEVKHLNERRSGLEDTELEVMEELEPLQADVDRLQQLAQDMAGEMRSASEELGAAQEEIDVKVRTETAQRTDLAGRIPFTLLAQYDALRAKLGGVAAAPLVGSSCGGCHLTFAARELADIRNAPPEAVVFCEECGRILVR